MVAHSSTIFDDKYRSKQKSDDRIIVLESVPGQNVLSTTGLVDNRLFKGGNTLHAIRDPANSMWYMKYETGILPVQLQMKFTRFEDLINKAKDYFGRRGLQIAEVKD